MQRMQKGLVSALRMSGVGLASTRREWKEDTFE